MRTGGPRYLRSGYFPVSTIESKALRKAEYSDFRIFAEFKTQNILYIPYISKISRQNQTFIFAKYSF
jgi:hypothetical protein